MVDLPPPSRDPSPSTRLRLALDRIEQELERLRREERDMRERVRGAREQVRYYDVLLQRLKNEWTGPPNARDLVQRLG